MQDRRRAVFIILAILWILDSKEVDAQSDKPHIIFIFADDLGWNDVSYHGSPEIPTPNIDALAMNGIALHNYYAQHLCGPSRGALMSGQYPIRLGMQTDVFKIGEKSGLSLNITLLPQHLKNLGYKTHMIGKWHLGYMTKEYTPTHRGFDTFFGYYNGLQDYYDYTTMLSTDLDQPPYYMGIDLHNGTEHIRNFRARYSMDVYTEAALNIVSQHDVSEPLFLYFATPAVHSGNMYHMPEQAPPEIIEEFLYIKDYNRRIHAARAWTLDKAIGNLFTALENKGMLQNSIVVFSSDNGGQILGMADAYSSNYPLRGRKSDVWEGGIRVPGLLWSPLLKQCKPRISTCLMHVTDWLPTLYEAAGGNEEDLGQLDGLSHWATISEGNECPRTELLYNIDIIYQLRAIQRNGMKVIQGSDIREMNAWYGPTGMEYLLKPESMENWVFRNGSEVKDILKSNGWWICTDSDSWYADLEVNCVKPPPSEGCNATITPCLFNITADPCEYEDLSHVYPEMVKTLIKAMDDYEAGAMPSQFKPSSPEGDPMCHNYTIVPFLDPEYYYNCNPAANTD